MLSTISRGTINSAVVRCAKQSLAGCFMRHCIAFRSFHLPKLGVRTKDDHQPSGTVSYRSVIPLFVL